MRHTRAWIWVGRILLILIILLLIFGTIWHLGGITNDTMINIAIIIGFMAISLVLTLWITGDLR